MLPLCYEAGGGGGLHPQTREAAQILTCSRDEQTTLRFKLDCFQLFKSLEFSTKYKEKGISDCDGFEKNIAIVYSVSYR